MTVSSLRGWRGQPRGGSNPLFRTNKNSNSGESGLVWPGGLSGGLLLVILLLSAACGSPIEPSSSSAVSVRSIGAPAQLGEPGDIVLPPAVIDPPGDIVLPPAVLGPCGSSACAGDVVLPPFVLP